MAAKGLGCEDAVHSPSLEDDHHADEQHSHEHVHDASEARRDLGNILVFELGENGTETHAERSDTEGHHEHRHDAKIHHERCYLEERVRKHNQHFREYEEREQTAPELSPEEI